MSTKLNTTVEKLVKYFFNNCIETETIDIKQLEWEDQDNLLKSTFLHPQVKKYPVNADFAKIYLKNIIKALEGKSDVHDGLYTCLCDAMSNSSDFCYKHYLVDNDINKIITIQETRNMVVNGTTGMRTWEAGVILADWALSNMEEFTKRRILELGSGIGLTGIAISKHCNASSIFLTDCHDDVLKTICTNIELNFPYCTKRIDVEGIIYENTNLGVLKFDWNVLTSLATCFAPDIVIGADIVYDPAILQPLCDVFNILCKNNPNVTIYIASVIRNKETHEMFLNMLGNHNYFYEQIEFDGPIHLNWKNVDKCLLKIKKVVK